MARMKSSGLFRGEHFVAGDGNALGVLNAAFHFDEAQLAGAGDAALDVVAKAFELAVRWLEAEASVRRTSQPPAP